MARKHKACPLHPEFPADQTCYRCGNFYCSECVKPWNGRPLGPVCRRERILRRAKITGVVALMLLVPAGAAVWHIYRQPPEDRDPEVRMRKKLLEQSPNSPGLRMRLARSLARRGHATAAKRELLRIAKDHPSYFPAALELAQLARKARNPDEVLRWTGRVLQNAPNAPAAHELRVWAYEKLGVPHKAEAMLRRSCKARPRAAGPALRFAHFLARHGRGAEARSLLKETLARKLRPHEKRRIEQALATLTRAAVP